MKQAPGFVVPAASRARRTQCLGRHSLNPVPNILILLHEAILHTLASLVIINQSLCEQKAPHPDIQMAPSWGGMSITMGHHSSHHQSLASISTRYHLDITREQNVTAESFDDSVELITSGSKLELWQWTIGDAELGFTMRNS